MADKKTVNVCFKVTAEMAVDLMRSAVVEGFEAQSDFIRSVMERELYGRMVKVRRVGSQLADDYKVIADEKDDK